MLSMYVSKITETSGSGVEPAGGTRLAISSDDPAQVQGNLGGSGVPVEDNELTYHIEPAASEPLPRVTLTEADIYSARLLALSHNGQNRRISNPDLVLGRPSLSADEVSAVCCAAVEKLTGTEWRGRTHPSNLQTFQQVGEWQVRGTEYDYGHIRVRQVDPPDLLIRFVIANLSARSFLIFPPFQAGDGKRQEFRDPAGDWYQVPQWCAAGWRPSWWVQS